VGEGYYHSLHHETRAVLCSDDFDYWRALADVWESDRPICNIEHDIDVREHHLTELLACRHGACAWAYRCNWISTGIPGGVIAAGTGARDPQSNPDPGYLAGGEEWAAWSAIGLVKIAPEARIGPLRREPWGSLELAVHDAVKRPWHLHGNAVGGAQLVPHWHF
jgi:hypothetical protein